MTKRKKHFAKDKTWLAGFYKPTAPGVCITIKNGRDDFLKSPQWKRLRMEALVKYGNRCQCCGASPSNGAVINVDHIKPRSKYPQLALDIDNLQILCGDCNAGKGNWSDKDWR